MPPADDGEDRWPLPLLALARKLGVHTFGSEAYDLLMLRIADEIRARGWPKRWAS